MEDKSGFQRAFLIFVNEDSGYEAGQKPSGHIKLEVRDGHGKLRTAVQNLRQDARICYKLYLIMSETGKAVYAGSLPLMNSRAELEWEFNPRNVALSGYAVDNFNTFSILAEYVDRKNTSVICPLAAYRGKAAEWRSRVRDELYKKGREAGPGKGELLNPVQKTLQNASEKTGTVNSGIVNTGNMQEYYNESKYIPNENKDFYMHGSKENFVPEKDEGISENYGPSFPEDTGTASGNNGEVPVHGMQMGGMGMPQGQQMGVAGLDQQGQAAAPGGINTGCMYLNGNMCGMYLNNNTASPCDSCRVDKQRHTAGADNVKVGDIGRLAAELDIYFESSDPFHSKRSDYKWWKVTNPVNLNNLLFQCGVRSPLLFNPAVMMAHFKYKHLIIGIYTDKMAKKEYVVCGVPGMHMVDRRPFGDLCRWAQTEGTRPRYGVFGYWLVYVDPASGRILDLK